MKLPINTNLNPLLKVLFVVLACVNFTIVVFVSGVSYITLTKIMETNQAHAFLNEVNTLPIDSPQYLLAKAIVLFLVVLVLMSVGRLYRLGKRTNILMSIFILLGCMSVLYYLQFSNNSIILLFIAYVLYTNKDNVTRIVFLLISIVIYLIANYNMLSIVKPIPLYEYISWYNNSAQFQLNTIDNFLLMLNIIVFIMFMFVMVLEEVNQSKRIQQLNDELKVLNTQLQEYASLQEKMGETKERNRLAREIHDTLGHTLTGLSVGIDAAMMILDVDSEATKKQLSILSDTARQGLKDVRRSVEKLRPDALERYSLQEALHKMIVDFEIVSQVKISFVCHLESLSFNKDEEEVIYRIVQEGLTNALRHGHAKHVFISFAMEANTLVIIIEDDGIGCENVEFGFGLHHMEERVNALQGKIRAYGYDGFVIIAEIPIRKES